MRRRYEREAENLCRLEEEKARAGRRGRGRPRVVKPDAFDLQAAVRWLLAHQELPAAGEVQDEHPALALAEGVPQALLAEMETLSEARFWQRLRRFAIRLLAALAGCSESTAYNAVKRVPDLPDPDLRWRDADEWIVGRDAKRKERLRAKRDRLDPGPQV